MEKSTNIDYAKELSILKMLNDGNLGKKLTDEQFNRIFEEVLKSFPELFRQAVEFEHQLIFLLMLLREETIKLENSESEPK